MTWNFNRTFFSASQPLGLLLKETMRYPTFMWGYFISLVGTAASLGIPLVLGKFIDALTKGTPFEELIPLLLIGFALFVIQAITGWGRRRVLLGAALKLHHQLRGRFFAHVLGLDLFYHRIKTAGEIATLVEYDTREVATFWEQTILNTLVFGLTLFGTTIALLYLSPQVALVALLPALLLMGIAFLFHRKIRALGAQIQISRGAVTHQIYEALMGLESVKVYQGEAQLHDALLHESQTLLHTQEELVGHQSRLFPVIGFAASLVLLLTLAYGGWQVSTNVVSLGSMAAFYYYIARALGPIRQTPSLLYAWSRAGASYDRLNELSGAQNAIVSGGLPRPQDDVPWSLSFEEISFQYTEEGPVILDQVSLSLSQGEYVAILGPSGAGKSTFGRLIPRLLDPSSGAVSWSGVAYQELDLSSLRRGVGYVGQDVFLFDGTLRENLLFGLSDDKVDEFKLKHALWIAGVDEIVESSPQGLDTHYGQSGGALSGGQKKRVALARALLREPQVLVIDQLASDLEARLHRAIFSKMHEHYQGSVIYLGHRVPECFSPTQQYWLEDGELQRHEGK